MSRKQDRSGGFPRQGDRAVEGSLSVRAAGPQTDCPALERVQRWSDAERETQLVPVPPAEPTAAARASV
jgi:hypothetical protein